MAIQLHIASKTLKFRDRAVPAPRIPRVSQVSRMTFRDTDFLTVERLGPMQSLTPEGFLIIRNVPLARTGPQLYSDQEIPIRGDASGRIIIDREPEEVFRPQTLASLNGKAVTLDHPDEDVTPENYKGLLVGTVINPRRGLNAIDNLLLGDLVIYDPAAIKAIRDKEVREVSVGYKADYEETGDARGRQRNIICNHLALVRDGRCGPVCRIGDKAFFPRHETDCGCSACTHDADDDDETEAAGETAPDTEALDDIIPPPVPLDAELLELAKGAPPNIVQQIYEEQARRNQSRPDLMAFNADSTQDSKPKRTGRRVHLHLRRD